MRLDQLVVNTWVFEEEIKKGRMQYELLEGIKRLGLGKVEVRREYFRSAEEFSQTREKADALGMELYYSVPDVLFDGKLLSKRSLIQYFEEANVLGANHIKLAAGYTNRIRKSEIETLKELIQQYRLSHFTIENDQNAYSTGNKMYELISVLRKEEVNIGFTFDVGNFLYVNEEPISNARILQDEVTFVHLKNIDLKTYNTTFIDEGDIDILSILSFFRDDVDVAIEYPCGDKPYTALENELTKLVKKESV